MFIYLQNISVRAVLTLKKLYPTSNVKAVRPRTFSGKEGPQGRYIYSISNTSDIGPAGLLIYSPADGLYIGI